MSMTRAEAIKNLSYFYNTYLPSYETVRQGALDMFEVYSSQGMTPEQAYEAQMSQALYAVAYYEAAFPGYVPELYVPFDENSIPASLIVDYFYPNASASDRTELVKQLENGGVTNLDFVYGWSMVAASNPKPSAETVFDAITEYTDSTPGVPDVELAFPGVSHLQLDLLVSAYVAAFGRAPEYDGLAWWANEIARINREGGDGIREIGEAFYRAGAGHGENGTDMSNADYVTYTYVNVLGRAPETAGHQYWTARLDEGTPRGEMIVEFVAAAQNGDRSYLDARLDVAKFVAQESVSGDPDAIDLVKVLEGVHDDASAQAAIRGVLAGDFDHAGIKAFAALSMIGESLDLVFGEDEAGAAVEFDDAAAVQLDDVELVGVAPDAEADLVIA